MSTVIAADCPTCGRVEFAPAAVRLRPCHDPQQSYYAFTCPVCSEDVYRPARPHDVDLLVSGGVQPLLWDVPDELLEGPHPGAPLTADDLLDLCLALEAHSPGGADQRRVQPTPPATSPLAALRRLLHHP